ncbi:hypothetical protein F5877DRAFT_85875 [Lentinula edodes]|nr:hypothetical protein F5877DRAFT_85875 [Lentinula edodes]
MFMQSTFSPSAFTTTQTGTGTVTGITGSSEPTQTTPTSSLRRPTKSEGSPRSPLTKVRNIVHPHAMMAQKIPEPLHLGTLYYLNVHAEPPYRWQRCQALLYCHTLLLSWLAPTTQSVPGPSTGRAPLGRAVVQLDLVNCFAVESALSLSHPRARDDVGAIAAREQDTGADTGLMESLVPFWMVYGDGVERLGSDKCTSDTVPLSCTIRYFFFHLTRTIDRRSGSPPGSIWTIISIDSNSSVSSTASSRTGSRSTVYVPPMSDIPDIPELSMAEDDLYASELDGTRGHSSSSGTGRYHSLISSPSVSSSGSGARLRPPRLISSHHSRTIDDTVIDGDEYVYPGDSRAIPSRPTSTWMSLRRSGSMTDLGSDALQSNRSSGLNDKSDDQFFTAGISSSAPRNSVYSSAESYSSHTGTGTGTRTFIGLTSSGIIGTGTTDTYTRTGRWSSGDSGTDSGTRVTESTRYTGYTCTTGTGVGTYASYSGSGSYTGPSSDSYAASGPNSENRSATTAVTGTGRTSTTDDYESRTGYGSGSHSGLPCTGTGSTYSPYTGTTGPPYTMTGSSYTGTGSPYTSTATYSSPYTRSSTSSSYPPTSPSRSALNRTAAMRRRTGTTRSYSSSGGSGSGSNSGYQPSEESSEKENDESASGSYTPASGSDSQTPSGPLSGTKSSETGYDVCPSSDLSELTSRMTYTSTSPWMSGSTPMPSDPSSSSDSDRELSSNGENFVTASQGSSDYLTTRTPSSEASFKSLPSIASEYTTASEGSIASKTIPELITEPTTA